MNVRYLEMNLIVPALTLLCYRHVSSQFFVKTIVPYSVAIGDSFQAFCHTELAKPSYTFDVTGVYSLSLTWDNEDFHSGYFKYSKVEGNKIKKDDTKSHWSFYAFGTSSSTALGHLNMDDFFLQIDIPLAAGTDKGYYCCTVIFYNLEGHPAESSDCFRLYVTEQTLVRPSLAEAFQPVVITCDQNVIPSSPNQEIKAIWITWQSDVTHKEITMHYQIEKIGEDNITIQKPEDSDEWSYSKRRIELDITDPNPIFRMDTIPYQLTVEIKRSQVKDSGFFCCGLDYYLDEIRQESGAVYNCQHLSVIYKSIAPLEVTEGDNLTIVCDARLAGILPSVQGMHRLQILWRVQSTHHLINKRYFSYGIDTKRYSLTEASYEDDWNFTFHGTEPFNRFKRLDVRRFRLEINIPKAGLADTGIFCCIGSYYIGTADIVAQLNNCVSVTVNKQKVEGKSVLAPIMAIGSSSVLVSWGLIISAALLFKLSSDYLLSSQLCFLF